MQSETDQAYIVVFSAYASSAEDDRQDLERIGLRPVRYNFSEAQSGDVGQYGFCAVTRNLEQFSKFVELYGQSISRWIYHGKQPLINNFGGAAHIPAPSRRQWTEAERLHLAELP